MPRTRALGGYIQTKRGRLLAYELPVNDVQVTSISDLIQVTQDLGTISATIWRDLTPGARVARSKRTPDQ
ncbi:MAG TPA: hypothetical protein VIX59_17375 [Candidatus Binataceae bacterium]